MNSNTSGSANGLISLGIVWGAASAVGFVGMAVLMIVADWSLLQGLFAAAIIFFVLGAILSVGLLRPLPGPVEPGDLQGLSPRPSATAPSPSAPATRSAVAPTPLAATDTAAARREAQQAGTAPTPADRAPTPDASATTSPADAEGAGTRPSAMDSPRDGGADDLKKIKGVGPKLEELLHSMGFYHFDQIAAWTNDEVAWVDENLEGFKGRVTRDDWVAQAKQLASGDDTEFSRKVDKGDVY